MHTTLRIITYTFLLALSMCWAYSFKPVEAQAQKSKPVRGSIGSVMSMTGLAMIAPTKDSALVSVNQAYFVNNQWYSAIFMYVKTDTRPANSSRVYINVTGRTGAWNVYKFGLDYSDVFGLQNILTGILSRASTDSIGLVTEVSRAKAAEGLKANTSYANSLSARQTADSLRLVNEVGRATTAEGGKLSTSDAASTYQLKGTYLTSYTETDPLYTANGATKTALSAVSTRLNADSLRDVNKVQTITPAVNGGIAISGTTQNPTVSRTIATYNNAPARVIGTSYQLSITRPTRVSYTVSVATAISLLNLNSSGVVYLEISSNNSTWTTVNSAGITRTLAVSISVGVNDTSLFNVQCEVPVGYYVRLRSVVSGGGTVTFMSGQEVID